jgi:hypothetical protein
MSNVVIYNIYWVPSGQSAPNEDLINRFTSDIGGPFVNLLAQYRVHNAVNFGGSWTDTKPVPAGPSINGHHIYQDASDIKGAISDAQNANPQWQPPGLSTLYLVYLPMHSELCFAGQGCTFTPNDSGPPVPGGGIDHNRAFCAYHSAYVDDNQPSSPIIYAAMPYDGDRIDSCGTNTVSPGYDGSSGPNGDRFADSEISTASHEIFESLTDPEPLTTNKAWTGGDNPIDPNFGRSGEIGDLCAYIYHRGSDGGDITLNGDRYFIQQEWSNATHSCQIPGGATPTVTPGSGCAANALPANDDGSTGSVALPFAVNFFGTSYTAAWVNNNGNITFNGPLSTYTPFSLLSTHTPIIAPYFSDVDTRGQSPVPSGLVTYGTTTFDGHQAFCVDWRNVGYYGEHTDKRDSFELLLVQRPDARPGDFDIVFNYDRVQWETGDASGGRGGLGGSSARAGFSNGTTNSLELVGSATNGALLDSGPDALTAGSHSSAQPGRYIFSVRNGANAGGATISGRVTDQSSPANPAVGALVQACGGFATTVVCDLATTSSTGDYSITSLPAGIYEVTVSPPAGSSLVEQSEAAVLLPDAALTLNFALDGPAPPPHGTTVGGVSTTSDGVPVLYWQIATPLTTHGCAGGSGSFRITAENSSSGTQQSVSGALPESPTGSGIYTAAIPALYPLHGAGTVQISITCPNPANDLSFSFTIYIDPSGTVVDADGTPVAGATVTLLRADDPAGPFVAVDDGSAVMSPGNRQNPTVTVADGLFGWDVVSGYYEVRAEKAGCTDPGNPAVDYVTSSVLTVPPAVVGVQLRLKCVSDTTTSVTSSSPTSVTGQPVTFTATVAPNDGGGSVAFRADGALIPGCAARPLTSVTPFQAACTTSGLSVAGSPHSIVAVYSGDPGYRTSTSSPVSQQVNRDATTTIVTGSPAAASKFGHAVTFTATLSTNLPGAGIPTGSATFKVDGVTVATESLSNGVSSITTSSLSAGPHAISATYGGDPNFLGSSGTLQHVVTCDVTVAATHPGAVIVTGSTCLTARAEVDGAVIVKPGGSLDLEGAAVHGPIDASSTPGVIRLCQSTVGGSVTVSKAGGNVIIGDAGDAACASNTISGALLLRSNTNGVEAMDNQVAGAVLVSNNSGPGPVPGDPTTISGNHRYRRHRPRSRRKYHAERRQLPPRPAGHCQCRSRA